MYTNSTKTVQYLCVNFVVHLNTEYAEGEREEDDGGQPQAPHAPVLVNGSPKPPHIEVSGHSHPQPYDVTLQRKDNEGFGFVILTSKNKPPPGG